MYLDEIDSDNFYNYLVCKVDASKNMFYAGIPLNA
jgi:hypothetical protein